MDADPLGGPTRDKQGMTGLEGWMDDEDDDDNNSYYHYSCDDGDSDSDDEDESTVMMVLAIDFWGVQIRNTRNFQCTRFQEGSTVLDGWWKRPGCEEPATFSWAKTWFMEGAYVVPMQTELVSLSSSLHVLFLFKKCIIAMATIVIVVFICSQPSSSFSIIIHHHSSVHWLSHEHIILLFFYNPKLVNKNNQKWSCAISEQPKTSRIKKTSEYFFSTTKISGIVKKLSYFLVNHQNIRHNENKYHSRSFGWFGHLFVTLDRVRSALISWGRPTNSKVPTMREGGWDVFFSFGWRFWLGFCFLLKQNTWKVWFQTDILFSYVLFCFVPFQSWMLVVR